MQNEACTHLNTPHGMSISGHVSIGMQRIDWNIDQWRLKRLLYPLSYLQNFGQEHIRRGYIGHFQENCEGGFFADILCQRSLHVGFEEDCRLDVWSKLLQCPHAYYINFRMWFFIQGQICPFTPLVLSQFGQLTTWHCVSGNQKQFSDWWGF